jgi:hypothetical protein
VTVYAYSVVFDHKILKWSKTIENTHVDTYIGIGCPLLFKILTVKDRGICTQGHRPCASELVFDHFTYNGQRPLNVRTRSQTVRELKKNVFILSKVMIGSSDAHIKFLLFTTRL